MKNLRGTEEKLSYFRPKKENADKIKLVSRIRKGEEQIYPLRINQELIFYDEDYVREFTLEKWGKLIPATNGNFTIINNYFFDYWTYILGLGPSNLYNHLLRMCYGEKDYCYPTLELIALKMNITMPTMRKYLSTLEDYGFVFRFWIMNQDKNNFKENVIIKVRKTVPFLTKDLLSKLPDRLRKDHDEYVESLMRSYDISLNESENYDDYIAEVENEGNAVRPKSYQPTLFTYEVMQAKRMKIQKTLNSTDKEIWDTFLHIMSQTFDKPTYDVYFKDTFCSLRKGILRIFVDSSFIRDRMEQVYLDVIKSNLRKIGVTYEELIFVDISNLE